jgi:hypothetical protein
MNLKGLVDRWKQYKKLEKPAKQLVKFLREREHQSSANLIEHELTKESNKLLRTVEGDMV